MPGFHIGTEHDRLGAGVVVAQLGHPLGRLPVLHLRIPQAGAHEQRRVRLLAHVVVRRVRQHVRVIVLGFRVAPLVVFVGGERNAGVEHGGDHIDERHLRDHHAIVLRRHVGHRAHQQAAGATTGCGNAVLGGVPLGDQTAGDIDKVIEGVFLVQQLAIVVPLAPHFLAAADVRDGIHHTAVQQADRRQIECRVHRHAVTAVRILKQRCAAVLLEALFVHQRHRHLDPVARGHPHAFGHVFAGVVADHRLLLEQPALAGLRIELVGGPRRGQRGVAVAQPGGIRLGVDG